MKKVVIFGSTGSVGKQVLNVISRYPNEFKVVGLSCNSNLKLLKEQMAQYNVDIACCKLHPENDNNIFDNEYSLVKDNDFDILVASSGGIDSLSAVLYALRSGKRVAIANKELLVCAGNLLMQEDRGNLIPVDSEHSAIYQVLKCGNKPESITLTCSGGAFRDVPLSEIWGKKAGDALLHPTWVMGQKITVDCATMANKSFEVIEAMHLFDLSKEQVNVLLHRQSIVHGFVTFQDGSIISQMSEPNMEIPISYALGYPERLSRRSDFSLIGKNLSFEIPDYSRYPLFKLITDNAENQSFCAFASGVDEASVNLFLKGCISYGQLHTIIEKSLLFAPSATVSDEKIAQQLYYEGFNKALEIRI